MGLGMASRLHQQSHGVSYQGNPGNSGPAAVGTLAVRLNLIAGTPAKDNGMGMASDTLTQVVEGFRSSGMIQDIHPLPGAAVPDCPSRGRSFPRSTTLNRTAGGTRWVCSVATPMPIPRGVRVAFPLEGYG